MIKNDELESMWEEVVVARLEIPAQNLPGGTAKYYEVLSQGSQ
jgi:hypothetical protein